MMVVKFAELYLITKVYENPDGLVEDVPTFWRGIQSLIRESVKFAQISIATSTVLLVQIAVIRPINS